MVIWQYKGKAVPDCSPYEQNWGFVYKINYTNGQSYIGKKQFWSVTKKPFGKRKLVTVIDKRAKKYEMVVKETKWRDYVGSSKETSGLTVKSKEILEICKDKINLTYCEIKWMIRLDVLVDDKYLNSNVLGKFFSPRITKGL